MYQQKQIIKSTSLCARHEDHIYTCSMPSPNLVMSQYDANLRVVKNSPAIQFQLWAFSPSSIVFIDGQHQKTGLLSKSDLSVSACDYFLRGLREHSIIPGQEKYVGTIGNDRCGMVDLQRNTIDKTWRNEMQSGFIMALPNGFLEYGSMPSGSKIFYRDYDDQVIWQTDVTGKGMYQKIDSKGKWYAPGIAQPAFYKDSVIFTAGSLLTRLELATGKIIWELTTEKKSSWPNHMVVADDTGFCNGGSGYIGIDLEKGTSSPVTRFKNFVEDGEEIYPYSQKLISHDGFLWASISSGGKNFIAAIDPQTGDYAWKQFIDVYGLILEPLFFGNYMLLKSDGGDIIVMEKTNN